MMEASSGDEVLVGIPPMITTSTEECNENSLDIALDGLQLVNDPTRFDKSNNLTPSEKEESITTDDTFPESSSGDSSCENDDFPEFDDCSDDESASSSQSEQTNNSTRLLLHQAQQRLHQQSVYEEVKLLRAEVSQYKTSTQTILRQKLELNTRSDTLESQLARAMETIQSYKLKELRLDEERAEREKDFMNQLNEVCSTMETREQELMSEIIRRDVKIIELQNMWNEDEMKRMKVARERKKNDIAVTRIETEIRTEIDLDDESWSGGDDCYGKFI